MSLENVVYSLGTGFLAVVVVSYFIVKRKRGAAMPTRWRRIGTLAKVNLFPIKSCASLDLADNATFWCDILGLRIRDGIRDRALMLVDDKEQMVTARTYPKMLLIQTKLLSQTCMALNAPGMPEIQLDFVSLVAGNGETVHTAVWGVQVDGILCGQQYDSWFSKFILGRDIGLHLIHYAHDRPVRQTVWYLRKQPFVKQEDSGTFVDGTSYMLMNLASIVELNTRLERPVDALQFRGNFDLQMDIAEPFAEDNWHWIRIGDDAVFQIVAPCKRCILPNINAHTGERDPDGEPFKTLKTYRLFNYTAPAIGVHLGLRSEGAIKMNDVIYVGDI